MLAITLKICYDVITARERQTSPQLIKEEKEMFKDIESSAAALYDGGVNNGKLFNR